MHIAQVKHDKRFDKRGSKQMYLNLTVYHGSNKVRLITVHLKIEACGYLPGDKNDRNQQPDNCTP